MNVSKESDLMTFYLSQKKIKYIYHFHIVLKTVPLKLASDVQYMTGDIQINMLLNLPPTQEQAMKILFKKLQWLSKYINLKLTILIQAWNATISRIPQFPEN